MELDTTAEPERVRYARQITESANGNAKRALPLAVHWRRIAPLECRVARCYYRSPKYSLTPTENARTSSPNSAPMPAANISVKLYSAPNDIEVSSAPLPRSI